MNHFVKQKSFVFCNKPLANSPIQSVTLRSSARQSAAHHRLAEHEWLLGSTGSMSLIIEDGFSWQEVAIRYSLPKKMMVLESLPPALLSDETLAAIFRQFYIRSGRSISYMCAAPFYRKLDSSGRQQLYIRLPFS